MKTDVTFTVPAFPRVHEYAGPWLLEASAARLLTQVAQRTDWAAHVRRHEAPRLKSALETVNGGTAANPKQVAVLRMGGLLMKQESSAMDSTSTVQLRRDIRTAAADPNVSGILLVIDSPGGSASGTDDLATEVRNATKRKPVMAFVEDLCASAAYYAASQADQVFANNPTALVGSIGTVMSLYDVSRAAQDAGVEALVFSTGPLKGAGSTPGAPVTAEQRDNFQALIDNVQTGFDAAVQKGRGLTDGQLKKVRTGQVWPADQAVGLGLIDGIKTYEQAVAAVVAATKQPAKAATPAATFEGTPMNFEQWAAGLGINLAAATRDRVAALQLAFEAETGAIPAGRMTHLPAGHTLTAPVRQAAPEPDFADGRKAAANETRRVAAIQAAGAKYRVDGEKVASAIEQGTDAKDFELEALRANYGGNKVVAAVAGGPTIAPRTERAKYESNVIVAALCMTGAMSDKSLERRFGADVLQMAHEQHRGGLGIQELAFICAEQNGYRGKWKMNQSNYHEVMGFCFPAGPMMSDGFSTISLPGILSNAANKFLLDSYMSGPQDWRVFCRVDSATDLKQNTHYRMTGGMKFEKVGPTGELKHGKVSEQAFTNQAETFGKLEVVTEKDFINDDLGAFKAIPSEMGRGGYDALNEAVYTELLDNTGTFYSSTAVTTDMAKCNSNLSATSPLGPTGLTAAKAVFAKQVKPDGTPLNVMPYAIIVPSELDDPTTVLLRDRELRDTTANNKYVTGNPHAGSSLVKVASPYLSNTSIPNNSATTYYLAADPAQVAGIAVVFLNGQQTPIIEFGDVSFNRLGVGIRGKWYFGVKKQDRRGLVQATAS